MDTPSARLRINPFLFPSETDLRFVLLVIVLLAESIYTYSSLEHIVFLGWQSALLRECTRASGVISTYSQFDFNALTNFNPSVVAQSDAWIQANDQGRRLYEECMRPSNLYGALWGLGGCILFGLVSLGIYWTAPTRKIRQSGFVPIPTEDADEIIQSIQSMCRETGLVRMPVFLWNPLNPIPTGLAFGRFGRHYVGITGGLVTQYFENPPGFRAVILHELAHIYNADIDKTYLASSAWSAFIAVVCIPQFFMIFGLPVNWLLGKTSAETGLGANLYESAIFAAIALLMLALVTISRNSLLRTREYYADARACIWDGRENALADFLRNYPAPRSRIPELLQVHPDREKRIGLLTDTRPLFTFTFVDALTIGVTAMLGTQEIFSLLVDVLPYFKNKILYAGLITALLYSLILTGIIGTLVWRRSFQHYLSGTRQSQKFWWQAGFGLGLGSAAGFSLSFSNIANSYYGPWNNFLETLFNLAWGMALGVLFALLLDWMAENAHAWLTRVTTPSIMRSIYLGSLLVYQIILTIWLGAVFNSFQPGEAFFTLIDSAALLVLALMSPFTTFVFILLWLCPLAVDFLGRQSADVQLPWAFLDPAQPVRIRLLRFRLPRAILMGLASGILFCLLDFLIRAGVKQFLPVSFYDNDTYRSLIVFGSIFLSDMIMLVAAVLAALSVDDLRIPHGLLAVFTGSLVSISGFWLTTILFGGQTDFSILFTWYQNSSVYLTLPFLAAINFVSRPD